MANHQFVNALGLDGAEWIDFQRNVFNGQLTRLEIAELLNLPKTSDVTPVQVRIWRNYACEPMEPIARIIGRYWNLDYDFSFTGYDDSLSFVEVSLNPSSFDVELVLIDTSHYQLEGDEFKQWLNLRLAYLQQVTATQVICVTLGDQIDIQVDGKHVVSLQEHDEALYDSRYEKSTGSRLTPTTHYLLGRELASTWLAERSVPPKKILAIDLDFTLHSGVLGESGMGVVVDDQFKHLQKEILKAKQEGLMLAVLSKNDQRDVLNLLKNHPDYLLRESDFVSVEASWGSKTDALARVLHQTRINQDAVIFIDDNPVELIQMSAAFPGVTCVSADSGPDYATNTLRLVPGYRRSISDHAADLRVKDIQSNEDRERLISNGLNTYYETAEPQLKVSVHQLDDLERLVDLGKRSNQFNLLLSRYERHDYEAPRSIWIALSLVDRFSDSGIIGGILCSNTEPNECTVLDLFLSCRVLGRGLETSLICSGLLAAMNQSNSTNLTLSWVAGDRNEPALNWLSKDVLSAPVDAGGSITIGIEKIEKLSRPPTGVKVEIKR
jgi:FkbH-like protein